MSYHEHISGFDFEPCLYLDEKISYNQIYLEDLDDSGKLDLLAFGSGIENGSLYWYRDLALVIPIVNNDNDGYCDYENADINPDALDIPGNGIDEDCNGEDAPILNYPFVNISNLKSNNSDGKPSMLNQKVKIVETIHGPNFQSSNNRYLGVIIDDIGYGVWIFSLDANTDIDFGEPVEVQGEVALFNGLTEIDVETFISVGTSNLVEPIEVSALNENIEGQILRINNLSFVDQSQWIGEGSFNVDLTDGSNTFQLIIDSNTELHTLTPPTAPFDSIGLGSQYDNTVPFTEGYQILPRWVSDFKLSTNINNEVINKLNMFPNPTFGKLYIIDLKDHKTYYVYSVTGQLIRKRSTNKISLDKLSQGIYFLEIAGVRSKVLKM